MKPLEVLRHIAVVILMVTLIVPWSLQSDALVDNTPVGWFLSAAGLVGLGLYIAGKRVLGCDLVALGAYAAGFGFAIEILVGEFAGLDWLAASGLVLWVIGTGAALQSMGRDNEVGMTG